LTIRIIRTIVVVRRVSNALYSGLLLYLNSTRQAVTRATFLAAERSTARQTTWANVSSALRQETRRMCVLIDRSQCTQSEGEEESRNRPGVVQRVPGGLGSQIS